MISEEEIRDRVSLEDYDYLIFNKDKYVRVGRYDYPLLTYLIKFDLLPKEEFSKIYDEIVLPIKDVNDVEDSYQVDLDKFEEYHANESVLAMLIFNKRLGINEILENKNREVTYMGKKYTVLGLLIKYELINISHVLTYFTENVIIENENKIVYEMYLDDNTKIFKYCSLEEILPRCNNNEKVIKRVIKLFLRNVYDITNEEIINNVCNTIFKDINNNIPLDKKEISRITYVILEYDNFMSISKFRKSIPKNYECNDRILHYIERMEDNDLINYLLNLSYGDQKFVVENINALKLYSLLNNPEMHNFDKKLVKLMYAKTIPWCIGKNTFVYGMIGNKVVKNKLLAKLAVRKMKKYSIINIFEEFVIIFKNIGINTSVSELMDTVCLCSDSRMKFSGGYAGISTIEHGVYCSYYDDFEIRKNIIFHELCHHFSININKINGFRMSGFSDEYNYGGFNEAVTEYIAMTLLGYGNKMVFYYKSALQIKRLVDAGILDRDELIKSYFSSNIEYVNTSFRKCNVEFDYSRFDYNLSLEKTTKADNEKQLIEYVDKVINDAYRYNNTIKR